MNRWISVIMIVALFVLPACSYHRAHFNHEDYLEQMPMTTSSWEGENLGTVAANEGGAIWNDCTKTARGSVWDLIDQTRRLGGNAIGDIRWIPKKENRDIRIPTCKRGWAWWLIFPVLLSPAFMSTRVEGVAYKVDDSELSRAGLCVIPDTAEDQERLVDQIVAERTPSESVRR